MDRGDWWAAVHGITGSQTRLSTVTHTLSVVIGRPEEESLQD